MHIHYTEDEISRLLAKAKFFNPQMGTFQFYAITEGFDYVVKLTNGSIVIKLDELRDETSRGLTSEQLKEIASRFSLAASAQNETYHESPTGRKEKRDFLSVSATVKIMAFLVLALTVGFAYFIAFDNQTPASNYQDQLQTIIEIERAQPHKFLLIKARYEINFWSDKIEVDFHIRNTATSVIYKDPVLEITYYSANGASIASREYVISDDFMPYTEKQIALNIENQKDADSLDIKVLRAACF